MTGVNFRATR